MKILKDEKINFAGAFSTLLQARNYVESIIIGKTEAIDLVLAAFLARGHVLLEDLPGTGKTTLVKTVARCLGCDFKRIQFTPDLMPADITGMNYYNVKTGEFIFRSGPLATNILLADEINRATPRTQSALLEAMEEKQFTVDGATRSLPQPFMVLATQNPVETEGTFPLPAAQQDRFILTVKLGYPARKDEETIIDKHAFGNIMETLQPLLDPHTAQHLQNMTEQVYLEDSLLQYILDLVTATRHHADVELALSPRASLGMVRAAKAMAMLRGRDYILPDDIKLLIKPVFAHRLRLKATERYKGHQNNELLELLTAQLPLPVLKSNP